MLMCGLVELSFSSKKKKMVGNAPHQCLTKESINPFGFACWNTIKKNFASHPKKVD